MRVCSLLKSFGWAGALIVTTAFAQRAEGSVILNITQSGSNVVASGSGTINLAALILVGSGASTFTQLEPNTATIVVGPDGLIHFDDYHSISGPSSFGSGGFVGPSSGSGDFFGIAGPFLFVPQGYISGAALSGTDTFNSATLSSLGLTTGTYVWTWGSGATADSFTVNVGVAQIPEPGSLSLLAAGFLVAGFLSARKRVGRLL